MNPVTRDQAEQLAKEIGCVKYIEISSKEGRNVDELFNEAVHQVLIHRGLKGTNSSNANNANGSNKKKKDKGGCIVL